MSKFRNLFLDLLLVMVAVLFLACDKSEGAYVQLGDLEKEISAVMPVLAVQTKEDAADSLDFIRVPSNPILADKIEDWVEAPYYEDCRVTLLDRGEVLLDNADVQVKVRGNWSSAWDKKPLRMKFKEKTSLLGMNEGRAYKNWILLAELKDISMLRGKTAFEIAEAVYREDDLYSSDSHLVSLVVNGQYFGVYLLAENQEIKEGRVDITKPAKDYTGTDIGYLLEMDGHYYGEEDLQKFELPYYDNAALIPYDGAGGSGRSMRPLPESESDPKRMMGITIKSDIYSAEQRDFICGYLELVYEIMYEAAYNKKAFVFGDDYKSIHETTSLTPREAVERVVNLDSLVDTYIVSEIACDADIYFTSFYMSVDMGPAGDGRLTFEAPWDFDSALGNKLRCPDGTGYYAANIVPDGNTGTDFGARYEAINPWLAVYAYGDGFMDMVKDKWNRLYATGIFNEVLEMISSDTEAYVSEFERNYNKWKLCGGMRSVMKELCPEERATTCQADSAAHLKEWLAARVAFLQREWGEGE